MNRRIKKKFEKRHGERSYVMGRYRGLVNAIADRYHTTWKDLIYIKTDRKNKRLYNIKIFYNYRVSEAGWICNIGRSRLKYGD